MNIALFNLKTFNKHIAVAARVLLSGSSLFLDSSSAAVVILSRNENLERHSVSASEVLVLSLGRREPGVMTISRSDCDLFQGMKLFANGRWLRDIRLHSFLDDNSDLKSDKSGKMLRDKTTNRSH